jgi:hypothetical protein
VEEEEWGHDSPSLSPDHKRSKGMGRAWDQPPQEMDVAAIALWQQQVVVAASGSGSWGKPVHTMGECARFGTVKSLHLLRPSRSAKKEAKPDSKEAVAKG